MIETIKSAAAEITIDPKEVTVYLGYYSANGIEDKTINEAISEFESNADYRVCFAKVPVTITGDSADLGFMQVESKSLCKNLDGCDEAYILAATTGISSQRLIEKNSVISPIKGIVTDCVGSAAIEAFCDKINLSLSDNPDFLRPRFSPGYGDLCIDCQIKIVEFLCANKNIGLSLTESLMMIPKKSVTAIIGIGKEKNKCKGSGCMTCKSENCPYR
ncbi:MAG: hypothetical protein IKJ41_02750 [Clostridia bacterium]|nr:hypothetical protein [Clostridia bacterium]MBR3818043.1 hypothetical protein [Clostridia bacterium]